MIEMDALEKALLNSEVRALARLISAAEDRDFDIWRLLAKHYLRLGRAKIVGITGPPGAGKSTLIGQIIRLLRQTDRRVGVLAVDPISPHSQGALLGDRIRLSSHFNDSKVFIRSVSTRGRLGGLSVATREAVHLMDLAGFEWVFLETVGVGQSEVDVRRIADVTLVVLVPESGDEVQAMKAGVLEIGDILVVNKSDREGAQALEVTLKEIASFSSTRQAEVFSTRHDQPETTQILFDCIERKLSDDVRIGKRRTNRLIDERAELIESWVLSEIRGWLQHGSTEDKDSSRNPYLDALKFTQSWRLPAEKK